MELLHDKINNTTAGKKNLSFISANLFIEYTNSLPKQKDATSKAKKLTQSNREF